jgi:hypothetical protein
MTPAEVSIMLGRPLGENLILGRDIVTCDRCGRPTFWRRPRQTKRGTCPDHALWPVGDLKAAMRTLARTFELGMVTPEPVDPDYAQRRCRVVMHGRFVVRGWPLWIGAEAPPLDVGPCERCRRPIRRYGPSGAVFCNECEGNSP